MMTLVNKYPIALESAVKIIMESRGEEIGVTNVMQFVVIEKQEGRKEWKVGKRVEIEGKQCIIIYGTVTIGYSAISNMDIISYTINDTDNEIIGLGDE